MNYIEQKALKVLQRDFLSSPKWTIFNLHVYLWESDYLAVTNSLYAYEIEVKMSESDYKNDFKKVDKHLCLSGNAGDIKSKNKKVQERPNYFFYACPEGIIDVKDVPWYAGLIYLNLDGRGSYRTIKQAPFLHKNKFCQEIHNMTDKFYYNMWTWRRRAESGKYGDTDEARKKGVAAGAKAVRESAKLAFAGTCPFVSLEHGPDFPQCNDKECTEGRPSKDCFLQCKRGKEFMNKLK